MCVACAWWWWGGMYTCKASAVASRECHIHSLASISVLYLSAFSLLSPPVRIFFLAFHSRNFGRHKVLLNE